MADFVSLTCDKPGCGQLKRKANHWYRMRVDKPTDGNSRIKPRIVISAVEDLPDRTHDACSLGCLLTLVQTAVSELYGPIREPEPEPEPEILGKY